MPEDGPTEMRCSAKLHGVVIDGRFYEVSCGSRWCGKRTGNVVLHRFDLFTGEMTTRYFKEPPKPQKRGA